VPELPEVEVLARYLAPRLHHKTIRAVRVLRARVLRPTLPRQLQRALVGAKFVRLSRRGKYLLFELRAPKRKETLLLIGHLGMTGRMYFLPAKAALPKHAAVVLNLGRENFVFEDTRYFGRFTLDASAIEALGPEPLDQGFAVEGFALALKRSAQPIKVKLLDQSIVAGVGNIYASEALFQAGISPTVSARKLTAKQIGRLWIAIREVLTEAIQGGSTVPLNYAGSGARDGLFYFGRTANAPDSYEERLRVYDRHGQPCVNCGEPIRRLVQAARSTFWCAQCQQSKS
jgi:formamidopyrimidine-DNA glycosylase